MASRERKRQRTVPSSQQYVSDELVVSNSQKTKFESRLCDILNEANPQQARDILASNRVAELEVKNLTALLVRYCLFKNAMTPGVPIRRAELGAQLGKGHLFNYFLRIATADLASVYGLELRQLYKVQSAGSVSDQTVFVLRSALPEPLLPLIMHEKEIAMSGFILAVVAIIRINGGKMEKEEFLNNLEQLGFVVGDPHPEFGQWEKKLLEVVLQRRYLITYKGGNGNEEFYAVGEAGLDEFSDEDIEAFVQRLTRR